MAFRDGRALFLAGKLQRDGALTPSDSEPENVDWINDSTRPLIHAIPPRHAAEVALRIAEETDELVASLSPELVAKIDANSPLNPVRAHHRGEHLDEIEAALAGRDATRRPDLDRSLESGSNLNYQRPLPPDRAVTSSDLPFCRSCLPGRRTWSYGDPCEQR